MNRIFQEPLIRADAGGHGGGGATLSSMGQQVVQIYRAMQEKANIAVAKEHLALQLLLAPEVLDLHLSARNTLVGKVLSIDSDGVVANVKFALSDGQVMTASVTAGSIADLRLRKGSTVKGVFKANKIILGKDM